MRRMIGQIIHNTEKLFNDPILGNSFDILFVRYLNKTGILDCPCCQAIFRIAKFSKYMMHSIMHTVHVVYTSVNLTSYPRLGICVIYHWGGAAQWSVICNKVCTLLLKKVDVHFLWTMSWACPVGFGRRRLVVHSHCYCSRKSIGASNCRSPLVSQLSWMIRRKRDDTEMSNISIDVAADSAAVCCDCLHCDMLLINNKGKFAINFIYYSICRFKLCTRWTLVQ